MLRVGVRMNNLICVESGAYTKISTKISPVDWGVEKNYLNKIIPRGRKLMDICIVQI